MQRILSLATLAVLGGLAWLFLREGGLDKMAPDGGGDRAGQVTLGEGVNLDGLFGGSSQSESTSPTGARSASYDQSDSAGAPAASAGSTIRIASFSSDAFGDRKAENEAVVQTLVEIVRRFHVVAVQEIRSEDEYLIPNLVRRINKTGRQYDYLIGPRTGNSSATEQFAFFFDQQRVQCDRQTSYAIRDPENLLSREPLVASFRARGAPVDRAFTFTLVNVHVDSHMTAEELNVLAEVYRIVRQAGGNEDDVIMLGDFNADDRQLGRLGRIPGVAPLLRGISSDTRRTTLVDNIVIHQPSTTEYLGKAGVFDFMRLFNLTQDSALLVSDHLPIYAEFSIYELDYAGRIASRGHASRR